MLMLAQYSLCRISGSETEKRLFFYVFHGRVQFLECLNPIISTEFSPIFRRLFISRIYLTISISANLAIPKFK